MAIRPSLIERVITIAEEQSRGVRTPVTHIHKTGADAFGPTFADPVELSDEQAPMVEDVDEDMATGQGVESVKRTKLTFFVPLDVDRADRFRIADSPDEWNVVRIEGLRKPDGTLYMPIVWLGSAPANG